MVPDVFGRLPGPAALFLLCALLDGTSAGVLPEAAPLPDAAPLPTPPPLAATTTVLRRVISAVPWPLPTAAAAGRRKENALFRRASTVCGYIGGDPNLPATCSTGSHCVLDTEHGFVGCCPDGEDTCTSGVYTGCVDETGASQTVANPYVYTCSGVNSVCYKNEFAGGYFQYGCGTASTQGTTVATTATGRAEVALTSLRVTFTGSFGDATSSSLTTSSASSKSSSSSRPSSSSSSSSSTSSSSASSSPSSSPSSAPAQETKSGSKDKTGVIVGATISGVAGVIAAISVLVLCLWKRRQRNRRSGPGSKGKDTAYIRPMEGRFLPLPSHADDFDGRGGSSRYYPQMAQAPHGTVTTISAGGPPPRPPRSPADVSPLSQNPYSTFGDDPPVLVAHDAMRGALGPENNNNISNNNINNNMGGIGNGLPSRSRSRPFRGRSYRGVTHSTASLPAGPLAGPPTGPTPPPPPKGPTYRHLSLYDPLPASVPPTIPPLRRYSLHLAPDQVPLTQGFDEFVRGQPDVLSRIDEVSSPAVGGDSDGDGDSNGDGGGVGDGEGGRNHRRSHASSGSGHSAADTADSGLAEMPTSSSEESSLAAPGSPKLGKPPGEALRRPLWQQNRI